MEEAQSNVEGNHEENRSAQFIGAHHTTENSSTRMDKLLPYGKYASQTQRCRQLGTQPLTVLYMARLEEARKEKKESDSIRHSRKQSLRIQPHAQRRLGNSTKS